MTKDTCQNCVYQLDRDKMLGGQGIGWGSSQPHPCTICMRFPRDDYPDNYQPKGGEG